MIFKKLFILIVFSLIFPISIFAQENRPPSYQAEIIQVMEEKEIEVLENTQIYQKLKLKLKTNDKLNQYVEIESGSLPMVNQTTYKVGDKVMVSYNETPDGKVYFIEDFIRTDPLLVLFIIFTILTLVVAKKRGLFSIFGMIISFFVIFTFILPQIASGKNPILVSILSSIFLIPTTFILSHGFNKKTISAILGTIISLFFTILLTLVFVSQSHLTGFATEEAGFLAYQSGSSINMVNLVIAGIIVGLLGILDDITIAQSSFVFSINKENKKLNFEDLYQKSMQIGRDHISSMVNTLILVYAAGSLPLFLLFLDSSRTFIQAINYEPIAQEIIIMLISSIALIISVPITNFIACFLIKKK